MAGIIVADTLQNGAGTSTSMTNAINGSAKAWVNFCGGRLGTAGAINASYNVSSITVNGTGNYTINFTSAFSDANYALAGAAQYGGDVASTARWLTISSAANPTASGCSVATAYANGGIDNNQIVTAVFFR